MAKNYSRWLGLVLVVGALIALWFFLPELSRGKVSKSGVALMTASSLRYISMCYLVSGLAAGFGLALLLWPFKGK